MNQYDLVTQTALVAGDDINQWEGYEGVTDSANEIAKIAGFSVGVRIFLRNDANPAYFRDGDHFDLVLNPDDADILGKEGFKSYFAKIVREEFYKSKESQAEKNENWDLISNIFMMFANIGVTVLLAMPYVSPKEPLPEKVYGVAAAFVLLSAAYHGFNGEQPSTEYDYFQRNSETIKRLTIIEQGEVTEEGGKLLLWAQREAANRAFKATTRISGKEQFLEYLSKDFTTQESQPQQGMSLV